MLELNEDAVAQLAPDAASLKAARGLLKPAKWPVLGFNDRTLWGECKGSGSKPYVVMIDSASITNGSGYKCSCPSRKFPCKHTLALLFFYANDRNSFTQGDSPEYVNEWLAKRVERAEKAAAKAALPPKPVDEAARQKRLDSRHKKVLAGIETLELWVKDLLRTGLYNLTENPYHYTSDMIKQLVNAQAPGLANRVDEICDIARSSYLNRNFMINDRLAQLVMLIRAYRNIELLNPDWQAEIRTQIGYTTKKEEVVASTTGVTDNWYVLAKHQSTKDSLTTNSYLFYGQQTKQVALVLTFDMFNRSSEEIYYVNTCNHATLHFYPGVGLLPRAVVVDAKTVELERPDFSNFPLIIDSFANVTQGIATNPFTLRHFFMMNDMRIGSILSDSEGFNSVIDPNNTEELAKISLSNGLERYFVLMDREGSSLPITGDGSTVFKLLTRTLGKPAQVLVCMDDQNLELLGIYFEGRYYA